MLMTLNLSSKLRSAQRVIFLGKARAYTLDSPMEGLGSTQTSELKSQLVKMINYEDSSSFQVTRIGGLPKKNRARERAHSK